MDRIECNLRRPKKCRDGREWEIAGAKDLFRRKARQGSHLISLPFRIGSNPNSAIQPSNFRIQDITRKENSKQIILKRLIQINIAKEQDAFQDSMRTPSLYTPKTPVIYAMFIISSVLNLRYLFISYPICKLHFILASNSLEKEESSRKAQRRIESRKRIFGLEKESLCTKRRLLGHLTRVRDARLVISVEQLLAVRDSGRRNGIRDRSPHRCGEEDPRNRGPPGVRDHALQDVVGVALDDEALVGDDGRARDDEPDEEQMEDGIA